MRAEALTVCPLHFNSDMSAFPRALFADHSQPWLPVALSLLRKGMQIVNNVVSPKSSTLQHHYSLVKGLQAQKRTPLFLRHLV